MTAKKPKHLHKPAGRPTQYTDEMPAKLLELRKLGKTHRWFCLQVDICEDTFYRWVKEHPAFSEAYTKGRAFAEAVWEDKIEKMMLDKNINAPLVKMYMANCFHWSDKKETNSNVTVTHESALKELE